MNKVDAIKQSVSIFDILYFYGVRFSGRITQQVSCPFHVDYKPSGRVYADSNSLYCWVCGKSWDVIGFVQDKEECGFSEALCILSKNFDIVSYDTNFVDTVRKQISKLCKRNEKTLSIDERKNLKSMVANELVCLTGYYLICKTGGIRYLWDMLDNNYETWGYTDFKLWVEEAKSYYRSEIETKRKLWELLQEEKVNVLV